MYDNIMIFNRITHPNIMIKHVFIIKKCQTIFKEENIIRYAITSRRYSKH